MVFTMGYHLDSRHKNGEKVLENILIHTSYIFTKKKYFLIKSFWICLLDKTSPKFLHKIVQQNDM